MICLCRFFARPHGSGMLVFKSAARADQLRLAGLFQKNSDTDRMLDAGAAERHAMIADQHRKVLAERPRERLAFALLW